MLEVNVVGELTTKDGFNKYMGYSGHDVPKEDKKAEGYIVEVAGESNHEDHEGYLMWLPVAVFDASYGEGSSDELLVQVATNPNIYPTLSPLKQKKVRKLVKELL